MSEPFAMNPLDPELRRNPFPVYAQGRKQRILVHEGLPMPLYSVFRYDDCQALLRDDSTWSNDFRSVRFEGMDPELPDPGPPSMLGLDGESHHRLRSLVNKAFTPRIVKRLEGRMVEIAEELVDEAVSQGEVDLVQALTYPLPVAIIAEMIGIPREDQEQFKRWSDEAVSILGAGFFGGIDAARLRRQADLQAEMHAYFVPLAEERTRTPRDDLLTGLVQVEHEGSKLSHEEMLAMLTLILVAGNETTTTLIGNAVQELLAHPQEQARLRADLSLLPLAIEEVLRFASPVQFDPRRATRDLELAGQPILEDELVLCWIGSANRDAEVFDEPERFDVGRSPNPHVAFGFGVHFCLGSNLARLEAAVALRALLARTRHLELASSEPLPLHPSPVFRAATSLPLRLVGA